jgi:hypothetical protein
VHYKLKNEFWGCQFEQQQLDIPVWQKKRHAVLKIEESKHFLTKA